MNLRNRSTANGLVTAIVLCFLFIPLKHTYAQVAPFHRGVNLTGWFQVDGPSQVQFTRYTKQDFIQIQSLGFDVIRLPINLHFMTGGAPDYTLDPLFLGFLDQVVGWAEELEIHLVLDNHTFSVSENTDPNIGTILSKIWSQMASRYKARPEFLYYEVLNEPHGISDQLWNNIQLMVVEEIRKIDTTHYIIIGPASWNSYNNLDEMPVYPGDKLIYTFHFYDPFLFTHQGASWTSPSMEPVMDIPFPADSGEIPPVPPSLAGTWIGSAYNNYHNEGTVDRMRELLGIAAQFREQRGVPLFCGEFGVYQPNSREDHRVSWYGVIRHLLDSMDIAWTTWDYHGGFGLFEENSDGMFEHDLNVPLLEALGATIPEQTDYVMLPDSVGFIIYDDYIARGIRDGSWPREIPDFYSPDQPNNGKYCLHWTGASLYQGVVFDLQPDKDLSRLVAEEYALDMMVRGNDPGLSFDVRFLDTKTSDPADLPWRMSTRIDRFDVDFNSTWQHLHIPLRTFYESGAWYEQWYNPKGEFDWTAADRFEIVPEVRNIADDHLYFDNIHITNLDTALIYQDSTFEYVSAQSRELADPPQLELFPNPSAGTLNFNCPAQGELHYTIIDLGGRELLRGSFIEHQSIDISHFHDGLYILQAKSASGQQIRCKFILHRP